MATKAVFAAGILTAGAFYKGYLKDEQLDQLKSKLEGAVEDATAMLPRFLKLADIDGDDKFTAADGKMALSKARHCTFRATPPRRYGGLIVLGNGLMRLPTSQRRLFPLCIKIVRCPRSRCCAALRPIF